MGTIKSYTDLGQSKKLAEILPHESADMCYRYYSGGMITGYGDCVLAKSFITGKNVIRENDLPCWSLAALLSVLPKGEYKDTDLCCGGYKGDKYIPEWFCSYEQQEPIIIEICHADNPVDACVEMILKLHERKML